MLTDFILFYFFGMKVVSEKNIYQLVKGLKMNMKRYKCYNE